MATSDLQGIFKTYCNFGGSTGKTTITTKNMTKIFKDKKLYGKNFTSNDTDIAFSKVKVKGKNEIDYKQFLTLLEEVAPKYGKDHKCGDAKPVDQMKDAILKSGGPDTSGTTKTSKTGGVTKMTDTSQYTGAHKERFDESGKGKGIAGRADVADNSGYVGNYKGKDTYDKK